MNRYAGQQLSHTRPAQDKGDEEWTMEELMQALQRQCN